MRLLMNVTLPNEPFNTAMRDGSVGEKLDRILKETGAETVYFTERNGYRGAILIFNISDPSKIPSIGTPWLIAFNNLLPRGRKSPSFTTTPTARTANERPRDAARTAQSTAQ